jgi:hypothetical protein
VIGAGPHGAVHWQQVTDFYTWPVSAPSQSGV